MNTTVGAPQFRDYCIPKHAAAYALWWLQLVRNNIEIKKSASTGDSCHCQRTQERRRLRLDARIHPGDTSCLPATAGTTLAPTMSAYSHQLLRRNCPLNTELTMLRAFRCINLLALRSGLITACYPAEYRSMVLPSPDSTVLTVHTSWLGSQGGYMKSPWSHWL